MIRSRPTSCTSIVRELQTYSYISHTARVVISYVERLYIADEYSINQLLDIGSVIRVGFEQTVTRLFVMSLAEQISDISHETLSDKVVFRVKALQIIYVSVRNLGLHNTIPTSLSRYNILTTFYSYILSYPAVHNSKVWRRFLSCNSF